MDLDLKKEMALDTLILNMQNTIIDLLERNNITKTELAKKSGLTKQQIGRLLGETGNVTLKTINAVVHSLDKKAAIVLVNQHVGDKALYNHVDAIELKKDIETKEINEGIELKTLNVSEFYKEEDRYKDGSYKTKLSSFMDSIPQTKMILANKRFLCL